MTLYVLFLFIAYFFAYVCMRVFKIYLKKDMRSKNNIWFDVLLSHLYAV